MAQLRSLLVCAVLPAALFALPAQQDTPSEASMDPEAAAFLDGMVRSSQVHWPKQIDRARALLTENPRAVIEHLVAALEDDQLVPGEWAESQTYTACGNALTLLERLTDERICGLGTDWIGFSTHDHRSAQPSKRKMHGPWLAWLQVRADVPVERWFWGLSYAELQRISPLMRQDPSQWDEERLGALRELGDRAFPYLLDKLVDDEYAGDGRQFASQADVLLRRLTGEDVGRIEQTELLRLDPEHPDRRDSLAVLRNQASMRLVQRRWIALLVGR